MNNCLIYQSSDGSYPYVLELKKFISDMISPILKLQYRFSNEHYWDSVLLHEKIIHSESYEKNLNNLHFYYMDSFPTVIMNIIIETMEVESRFTTEKTRKIENYLLVLNRKYKIEQLVNEKS